MESKEKQTVVFFRESLWQSICADLFSYGMLGGMFWINYSFIGGNNFVDFVLLLIFIIMAFARGNSKAKRFSSKKEFKKYVDETFGELDKN